MYQGMAFFNSQIMCETNGKLSNSDKGQMSTPFKVLEIRLKLSQLPSFVYYPK